MSSKSKTYTMRLSTALLIAWCLFCAGLIYRFELVQDRTHDGAKQMLCALWANGLVLSNVEAIEVTTENRKVKISAVKFTDGKRSGIFSTGAPTLCK